MSRGKRGGRNNSEQIAKNGLKEKKKTHCRLNKKIEFLKVREPPKVLRRARD